MHILLVVYVYYMYTHTHTHIPKYSLRKVLGNEKQKKRIKLMWNVEMMRAKRGKKEKHRDRKR